MPVLNYPFSAFNYGLYNKNPIQSIPDGAAYDSLNWLTNNGKIELTRGYALLGSTDEGAGRVSGLRVGAKADNTEIPFKTTGKKVKYYDSVLLDWVEIGSDILGTAADGEDVTIEKFESRAGRQIWLNSPNSGPKKIMVANPGDYSDMYDANYNYKGWHRIITNQSFLFNVSNSDRNVVRLSYIETRSQADYTQITAEVLGAGNGVSITFPGVLAFKAGGSKRSCLDVTVTDGIETFSDNLNGTLTGSLGGTGTINYTTGAISVTFHTAVVNLTNVTSTYRWVDETATGGIANYVVPGSRVSGNPNVFRQDTGGDIRNIYTLKQHRFVGHNKAMYDIQLTLDDTNATNFLFRENLGIPSLRGGAEAPEGIYTIDVSDDNNPRFVIIGYNEYSSEIRPTIISSRIDLTPYEFDQAVVFMWNDYILFCCRTAGAPYNDTMFVYHRIYKTFDKLDYSVSCLDIYGGTLIAGDSISNNVYTLFSGVDDDGDLIYNYWKSGITKIARPTPRGKSYQIRSLKKVKKLSLEGEIGPDQVIKVFVSLDRGAFVEVLDHNGDSLIKGTGDYVDRSQRVIIGAPTLGTEVLGDGSNGIEAYHYNRSVSFAKDKFYEIQVMIQATNIGYASVTDLEFRDIRIKQSKIAKRYRDLTTTSSSQASGSGTNTGGPGTWSYDEVPTDSGDHLTFTLAHTPTGVVRAYRDGLHITAVNGDYSITGNQIILTSALQTGETLTVDYVH